MGLAESSTTLSPGCHHSTAGPHLYQSHGSTSVASPEREQKRGTTPSSTVIHVRALLSLFVGESPAVRFPLILSGEAPSLLPWSPFSPSTFSGILPELRLSPVCESPYLFISFSIMLGYVIIVYWIKIINMVASSLSSICVHLCGWMCHLIKWVSLCCELLGVFDMCMDVSEFLLLDVA